MIDSLSDSPSMAFAAIECELICRREGRSRDAIATGEAVIGKTDVVRVPMCEDETRINDVSIQKFHNENLVVNEQVGQNIDGGMHSGTMAMTDIIDNGAKDQQRKSFAQALQNSCDVPHDHLPKPCLKGEDIQLKFPRRNIKRV
ncbi:hypothetical protein A2U01_0023114 [Trifolium medium]|uniref:Uncharacterized protein n=1 Tax=Trifolium medium TaxID=97028 RepID=A0A392NRQ3_9FABA|nr:hypothetical protein [Trifolium medium]